MGTIKNLNREETEYAYYNVLKAAFPPEELKPLEIIMDMTMRGKYFPCGYFEGKKAVGYAFLWKNEDFVLIDYLCVLPEMRNCGIGAEIIKELIKSDEKNVFIAESEAPDDISPNNAMRLRRLGFYKRSGAELLNYEAKIFGVHYNVFAWSGCEISDETVMRCHEDIYRNSLPDEMFKANIVIPYGS